MVGVTVVAYLIALQLKDKASIFELAIRFAFSGFAAMAPVMIAALFWRRSNKWAALAATLWVAVTMFGSWYFFSATQEIAPKPGQPVVQIFPALGRPIPAQLDQRAGARVSARPADVPRLSAVDGRRLSTHSAA